MYVVKRNGSLEEVNFNKVVQRLKFITNEPYPLPDISVHTLAQTVIQGLHDHIHTRDIDIHAANICASMSIQNHQYGTLAGRIIINNHHKNTLTSFKDKMDILYLRKDTHGNICPLLDERFYKFVIKNQKEIESRIDYTRDFLLDYFSFKTLERSYLLKTNREIVERPQDMWMRVAIFLHMNPKASKEKVRPILDRIFETYDFMSTKYFTHATPTLFNAGTIRPSLMSCFLLGTDDSLEGIMKTATDCAQISKWAGGIGFHISNWRSKGALIRGTNGTSSGIVPFLKIYNDTARAFNQGGKRPGSFAAYIELHHPDILDFLQLRRNHGEENLRCRDLFLALWVCDLFMERVRDNQVWSLFDADKCPRLNDVYGDEYRALYEEYERQELFSEQVQAREIWKAIFTSQKESGIPYILYKDQINRSNNQANIGIIRSSNLCVSGTTMILTDHGYVSIRELASGSQRVHNIWNGESYSPAVFRQTGHAQTMLNVTVLTAKKEASNIRLSQLTLPFSETHLEGGLHYTPRVICCTPYHEFILDDGSRVQAKELQPQMRLLEWYDPRGNFQVFSVVQSIEPHSNLEDTYCFNEPQKHQGVFNGVMAGNCAEIVEFSNADEYACCTLASICLSMFVEDTLVDGEDVRPLNHEFPRRPVFNYKKLMDVVQVVVRNLNQVIDRNWYPTPETERSNTTHRPLGIGVQGLADVFYKFRCTYDSPLAKELNQRIFETMYYAAVSASTRLSREVYLSYAQQLQSKATVTIDKKEYTLETLPKTIGAYSSMLRKDGSPLFQGKFHWELYGRTPEDLLQKVDWESLRSHIQTFGVRNSLLIALMPTASTSQIMGNIESIEPLTSNIFKRQTLAGEFIVVNKYLMKDLSDLGLWNAEMENFIKLSNGSIQHIQGIPASIKNLYRTVWEISQQHVIDLAADRQPFVDQSQSMNLFIEDLTFSKFNSMHFYSWKKQLKTGCYYLRTRPAVQAQKFTTSIVHHPNQLSTEEIEEIKDTRVFDIPTQNDEEVCLVCSS